MPPAGEQKLPPLLGAVRLLSCSADYSLVSSKGKKKIRSQCKSEQGSRCQAQPRAEVLARDTGIHRGFNRNK